MTEENIFAYKLFFRLNISDFLFLRKLQPPPEKSHPTLKVEVLSNPAPFLKIWLEGQTLPPAERGREVADYGLSVEFLLHIFNGTYSTSKTF